MANTEDSRAALVQSELGKRVGEVPYPAQIGLAAIFYFVAASLSIRLAIPPGYPSAVWSPSGIALAPVLLLGARVWPRIWVAAAIANFSVEASAATAALTDLPLKARRCSRRDSGIFGTHVERYTPGQVTLLALITTKALGQLA